MLRPFTTSGGKLRFSENLSAGWDMLEPPRLSGTRMGFAWSESGFRSVQEPLPSARMANLAIPDRCPAPNRTQWPLLQQSVPRLDSAKPICSQIGCYASSPQARSSNARLNDTIRLEGAYEARQISLTTPRETGPYVLEVEFLLESGQQIVNEAAKRIAERLHECAARRFGLERQSAVATEESR